MITYHVHQYLCALHKELFKEHQYNQNGHVLKSERFCTKLIPLHSYLVFLQFYLGYSYSLYQDKNVLVHFFTTLTENTYFRCTLLL